MIDKVLILGIRRANQLIPDHEIGQMVGRCGRSYTESGEATLIVSEKDFETANEYMFGKPKPISSAMFEVENTAFHCIPAIHFGEIFNQETFENWYSRTLSFVQGKKITWETVKEFLLQVECLKEEDKKIVLTELGEISFRFYYPPDRIYWLKDKLQLLVNSGVLKNPAAISWLLAYQHCSIGDAKAEELAEYKSDANSLGLYFHCGELTEGYAYRCILSNRKPKWLKHKIEELRKDLDRLFGALQQIANSQGIAVGESLGVWFQCMKKKLPYELGKLSLEFPEATTENLIELESLSVHRKSDLERNKYKIEKYSSKSLRKYLDGISF